VFAAARLLEVASVRGGNAATPWLLGAQVAAGLGCVLP
jgi:hypothetical protein